MQLVSVPCRRIGPIGSRLLGVLALAALLVLAGMPGTRVTPLAFAAERPNILLINFDDARFDMWQNLPKTNAWLASGVTS